MSYDINLRKKASLSKTISTRNIWIHIMKVEYVASLTFHVPRKLNMCPTITRRLRRTPVRSKRFKAEKYAFPNLLIWSASMVRKYKMKTKISHLIA